MPLLHFSRPAHRPLGWAAALAWLMTAAQAQTTAEPAPSAAPTVPAVPAAPAAAARPTFEGAAGLILAYRPEYLGASRSRFKLTPGLFLRYGRLTFSNAGGFATRRVDDVAPGLALDMVRSERTRVGLSLRVDNGRSEDASAALKGLGNIRATVRLRGSASWQVNGPWRVGAAWSEDILGRRGGGSGDFSAGWQTRWSADTTLSAGASVGVANSRYLQSQFGVTPEQSARSGYAVYTPGAGWRDVSLSLGLRRDLNWGADERWIFTVGAAASRLIGPAAASPLTTARNGWGLNVGVARQF
jgi:MipA family protein